MPFIFGDIENAEKNVIHYKYNPVKDQKESMDRAIFMLNMPKNIRGGAKSLTMLLLSKERKRHYVFMIGNNEWVYDLKDEMDILEETDVMLEMWAAIAGIIYMKTGVIFCECAIPFTNKIEAFGFVHDDKTMIRALTTDEIAELYLTDDEKCKHLDQYIIAEYSRESGEEDDEDNYDKESEDEEYK